MGRDGGGCIRLDRIRQRRTQRAVVRVGYHHDGVRRLERLRERRENGSLLELRLRIRDVGQTRGASTHRRRHRDGQGVLWAVRQRRRDGPTRRLRGTSEH